MHRALYSSVLLALTLALLPGCATTRQRGANDLTLQLVRTGETGQTRANNPNADLRRHWRGGKNLSQRVKHAGERTSTGQITNIGKKLPARQSALGT